MTVSLFPSPLIVIPLSLSLSFVSVCLHVCVYVVCSISMCIPDVMDLVTKYLLIAVCHINGKDIHTTIPNTFMDYSLTTALPNDNQLR